MSTHWSIKWGLYAASVFSLSLFFAGWRQVNQTGGLQDWCLLVGGTASTLTLLSVQGYFIYFEEKARGRLTKRVGPFERIHQFIDSRKKDKGEGN
jgi:hypothetical protein